MEAEEGELQALCKERGLRANSKTVQLIADLRQSRQRQHQPPPRLSTWASHFR